MHRLLAPMVALLVLAGCGTAPTPARDAAPGSGGPAAASSAPSSTKSGAPTGPASPAASPTASRAGSAVVGELAWRPCEQGNECAELQVPLDYDDPDGPTITIALLRMPATDPGNRVGSLLYNPGGPGASGVETVAQAGRFIFSTTARARFDIVGFDPRGVGRSDPVRCLPTRPVLDEPYPDDPAEVEAWTTAARAVSEACDAQSGDVLPHVGTENVARDLDRIRAAVGDDGLTYLGQSYGTLIGALYADLFPDRVRAMVLDAPIDPGLSGADLIAGQAEGFEAAMDRFFTACPFLAWSPGWGSLDCAFWPVAPQRDPEPVDAAGVAPVLVIGATHDPATPYPWAEALAEQLPSSVLLTRAGDGHGSYGRNACVNGHTDDYLISLSLPAAGTVCR